MAQSNTLKVCVLTFALVLAGATGAQAALLPILEVDLPVETISDLTGFHTDGADMAGMQVTVFSNLVPLGETVIWAVTGAVSGEAASARGWTLKESGDTFDLSAASGLWDFDVTLDNLWVNRILIEGFQPNLAQDGDTTFDQKLPSFGTDGSARGRDFRLDAAVGNWDLEVTYRSLVDSVIDGPGAVGDLYRAIDLRFLDGQTGNQAVFGVNDTLQFRQDTDTVGGREPGNGGPEGDPVIPEPATCLTWALGLLGLRWYGRRKRRTNP